MSDRSKPDIAIVGIGCMFPGAGDREAFWVNVREGVDAIRDIPESHWDPRDYFAENPEAPDMTYARRGGFLDPVHFSPLEFGIAPRDIEATDTTQLLGLVASKMALEDAGYGDGGKPLDAERTSVILGVTGALELVIGLGARLGHPIWRRALTRAGVEGDVAEQIVDDIASEYVPWQENSFPGLLGNVAAGRIANRLDLHGTNCVVDAACASSLAAVHLAVLELETGRADMVLTGGIDTFNDIFMYMCFSKTPALSPSGDAKPFDASGDGTILGEGLGIVVLKRLEDAKRDGDRIYAVLKGMGTSSDGKGNAIYAPNAAGQARALTMAHREAGADPRTIELVEGHGTGTRVGDATEIAGLEAAFGSAVAGGVGPWCALGSVKSMIGHTKAAAGAAGLIKAAMALHHRVLPPTIKIDRPNDATEGTPFYLNTRKRPWLARSAHPRRAGVSAFGFGGSNLHAVLEEADAGAPGSIDWDGRVQIAAFSGADRGSIERQLDAWLASIESTGSRRAAAAARRDFDPSDAVRLTCVWQPASTSAAELGEQIRRVLHGEGTAPGGAVWLGEGRPGLAAALFPGQGSQYPHMLSDLACQFPEMRETIESVSEVLRTQASLELGESLFPQPAFDDATTNAQRDSLKATEVAQPALGAVSLGAWRVLQGFGLSVDAAAGHSYGELVALAAAGRIDVPELARLSRLRGELMAAGEGGTMLAALMDLDEAETFVRESGLDLVLANRNAPRQAVLSGTVEAINAARTQLEDRGVRTVPLEVSAAFHSRLVASACAPFADALSSTPFESAEVAVYSTATAQPYPVSPDACRDLLAGQLAQPVRFVELVDHLFEAGVRTFVEVGPGARLAGLVRRILTRKRVGEGAAAVRVLSLDPSDGESDGQRDLAVMLARLAALGHIVDLRRWDSREDGLEHAAPPASRGYSVELTGANYIAERPARRDPPKRIPERATRSLVPTEPSVPSWAPTPSRPVSPPSSRESSSSVNDDPRDLTAASALQASLDALLKLQTQTAALHQTFLETQDRATQRVCELLARQQELSASAPAVRPASAASGPARSPSQSAQPSFDTTEPLASMATTPAAPVADSADAAAPAAEAATPVRAQVESVLFEVVGEKTGYPASMLDASMGLDADLGIDSIKRVEILSALSERLPGAPVVRPEHMGELQTLGQLCDFLSAARGGSASSVDPEPSVVAASADGSAVSVVLLEVISDKTGYPAAMLEMSMGLDEDLGIDSIKRVEILSELRERLPDSPTVEPHHMAELQTLGQLAGHLAGPTSAMVEQRPPAVVAGAESPAQDSAPVVAGASAAVLFEIVGEKTGYPSAMLELSMGLDEDLGIDSIKRVEILSALRERLPDAPVISPDHLGELRTLNDIVAFLDGAPAEIPTHRPFAVETSSAAPVAPSRARVGLDRYVLETVPLAGSRPNDQTAPGLTWITRTEDGLSTALVAELSNRGHRAQEVALPIDGQEPPSDLAGLVVLAPFGAQEDADDFLLGAFEALRKLAPRLREAGSRGLFATISRLDGAFGLDSLDEGTCVVEAGGLAGLTKTAAREWPDLRCRALDLAPGNTAPSAEAIVAELLSDGPVEVGLAAKRDPVGLKLVSASLPAQHGQPETLGFGGGAAAVITGGARGVTAEVAVALAQAGIEHLLVLGRTDPEVQEPDWLVSAQGEAQIKRAMLEHGSDRPTPRVLERRCRKVLAAREARENLARMRAAGARVDYRSVDVRDAEQVGAAIAELRTSGSDAALLVHGAGVLADRRIEDKTGEDFRRVYDAKVVGLRILLDALPVEPLRGIVLFSSTTARLGRVGQADYAVANEVLNKWGQALARSRPHCRVLAMGWGPWAGGMVTPALRELFDAEGVVTIELTEGAEQVVRELGRPGNGSGAEVLLVGAGSQLPVDAGLAARVESPAAVVQPDLRPPELPTVMRRSLDLGTHAFLRSHVIDGKAVLPTAMMMEWLAHGALHGNPGLRFAGIDDFRVYKGAILEEGAEIGVRVCVGSAEKSGSEFRVEAQLVSGGGNGHRVFHARATVVLMPASAIEDPDPEPLASLTAGLSPRDQEWRPYEAGALFHGPAFQGIETVVGVSHDAIAVRLASGEFPRPDDWMQAPHRGRWITQPLAIDVGFQAMILWAVAERGVGSLPTRFDRFRQFVTQFPTEGVYVLARVNDRREHRATADLVWVCGDDGAVVATMSGYECVIDASLEAAFRRNRVAKGARAPT